ncbi:hypothetical protein [Intrasporangium chromatireducens]|nr:hypothetical protein [Intrasporangium chromatireducens]
MPETYMPPLHGDNYQISLRADLGRAASVDRVSEYLAAFHTVLDVGERWGVVMAEEASVRSLMAELLIAGDGGEPSLHPILKEMPWYDEKRIYLAVNRMIEHRVGEHPELQMEAPRVLREVASLSVPQILGPSVSATEVTYRNPIEIIVGGSAFALYGAVQLLRIIRDWKSRRRQTDSAARIADAAAREASARADVIEYLGNEITSGRLHVPASQLGAMLTQSDLSAVAKLAGPEPTLELPSNVSSFFGEETSPTR